MRSRKLTILAALLLPSAFVHAQWQSMNANVQVSSCTTQGSGIYVASPSFGVRRSTNDGGTWDLVNNGLPNTSGAFLVEGVGSNGQYLFAGTQSGIYRSANGGDSWTNANGTLTANSSVHAFKFFHFGNTTFAVFKGLISAGGGIQRTTDNGGNWIIGHSGMSTNMRVHHMAYTGYVLYAATSGGLFRSTDLGQQWTAVAGMNYEVFAVQYLEGRLHIISINGYRYSTNDGNTWTNSTGTPAAININKGELMSYNGNIYSTGNSDGVLISQNGGVSYSAFNAGLLALDQATVGQFHASPTKLYLGTLFNLWSIPGSTVGIQDREAKLPAPYPTAFTDAFQVDLSEQGAGLVLLLLDAMGREVRREAVRSNGTMRVDRGSLGAGRYSCMLYEPATGLTKHLGTVVAQ